MKERGKNILIFLVSCLVGLLIVEFGLRLFESKSFFLPIRVNEEGYTVHIKNLDKYAYDNENKKKVHIQTNATGFVGRDFPTEKPDKTLRVAVFGDSFTEAMQVDIEKNFASLIEKKMNEYMDKTPTTEEYETVEVHNFGVGGTGTADAIMYYERYARAYDPDVVVLNFYSGNDSDDNSKYFSYREQLQTMNRDEWKNIPQQGAAELLSFVGFKDTVFRSSAIVRLADRAIRGNTWLYNLAVKADIYRPPVVGRTDTTIPPLHFYYRPELEPSYQQAIDFSLELIREFAELVKEDKKQFVFVYIPEGNMVHAGRIEQLSKEYTEQGMNDFVPTSIHSKIIPAITTSTKDIEIVDFTAEMTHRINDKKEMMYLGDTGHFTEAGHDVVGNTLTSILLTLFNI